ncbi:protein LNK2 isoform X2 [Magnolia sinica]|uniref:protein LNK2 isoform X2 n=1 Tax=Magnolia sinica TaxID=86752 RepID=UPI002659662F|nr:protein LNK2 isoform X2 [Magnolia sinica]XP_058107033.1 protein LNK2 isoform X2 [Magnolia sinica]
MLADIIWGDANESDDHIVPYPKGSEETPLFAFGDYSKKQNNQETSTTIKPAEQKTSGAKNDFLGNKLEASPCFDTNEELSAPRLDMDPWPALPLSSSAERKQSADMNGRDSIGAEVSDDFPVVTDLDSVSGRLPPDPPLFGNDYEDKEGGSFLDYGWANIGNFDDLDRIFRNDSMLGHEMIGNTDELWSSSTNAITSPAQSFPFAASCPSSDRLRATSEKYEVKLELQPYQNQSLGQECNIKNDANVLQIKDEAAGLTSKPSLEEKTEDSTETTAETTASQSQVVSESSGIRNHFADKVNRQRKILKCRKKVEEKGKAKSTQNMCGVWPPSTNQIQQFGNPKLHASAASTLQTFPSSVLGPQRHLGGPESLRYVHNSSPFMHTTYGYPTHHFPVMPMLPQSRPERDQSQMVVADYKVSTDSPRLASQQQKLPDVSSRPLSMTPQEKIEKLRRRQQMQALLAIQHQQQQFGQQISSSDHSVGQKCSQENQGQDAIAGDIKVEEKSLEMNFPMEQDDSTKISMLANEQSLEETIFDQLQDAIGKLDIRMRLCVRDSLFRLARSAMQRNNISDTSSTNKCSRDENEVLANEETNSHDRSAQLPDVETDTNRIDRTVAHLLFHRPSEPGARPVKDEIPESPNSSNPESFPVQPKAEDWAKLPAVCVSDSLTDKQSHSYYESQTPTPHIPADAQNENPLPNNL